jgi:hypothetical protein
MTQCFKCYQYGHIAMMCWRLQTCRNCAKEYPFVACQTAKDSRTYLCSNCKGKHRAWNRACPAKKLRQNELQRPTQHAPHYIKSQAMPYQLPRAHQSIFTLFVTQYLSQRTKANCSPHPKQCADGHGSPLSSCWRVGRRQLCSSPSTGRPQGRYLSSSPLAS